MSIIERFRRILKGTWYRREEWVEVESFYVCETLEKRECPSWEVGLCEAQKYKNKDSCEERWRLKAVDGLMGDRIEKTVFDDPRENDVSFSWADVLVEHAENLNVDFYTGGKYE